MVRLLMTMMAVTSTASAQEAPAAEAEAVTKEISYNEPNQQPRAMELSGPRIGLVYLMGEQSKGITERLDGIPVLTSLGWQFEHHFFEQAGGFTGVNEFVLMVSGMDQQLFMPTASWLIVVRSAAGIELGIGPTLNVAELLQGIKDRELGADRISGLGAVIAAGLTVQMDGVNFPFNLAFVRSGDTNRFLLTCGFNMQDS